MKQRTASNGRSKSPGTAYVAVLKPTLKEPAWLDLSFGARCLYITIKSFYNGSNNAQIYLSVRKAAEEIGASRSSVEQWFRDLESHGFIRKAQHGYLGSNGKGIATYWRLTEVGCKGEQPTREYKNWRSAKTEPRHKNRDRVS